MQMVGVVGLVAMDANLILGIVCLGGLVVFLLRLVWLFVLTDEHGFRFSKKHDQRVEADRRALDELAKKLVPYVMAIRDQPERHISGAGYTFREGGYGEPLRVDKVVIFSAQTRKPIAVDALPAASVPLARRLESPAVKHVLDVYAKQQKNLKPSDRITIQAACVSLTQQHWTRFPALSLNIYIDQKGQIMGADVGNS